MSAAPLRKDFGELGSPSATWWGVAHGGRCHAFVGAHDAPGRRHEALCGSWADEGIVFAADPRERNVAKKICGACAHFLALLVRPEDAASHVLMVSALAQQVRDALAAKVPGAAGWYRPLRVGRRHFFNGRRSLCGKHVYLGDRPDLDLVPELNGGMDECAKCGQIRRKPGFRVAVAAIDELRGKPELRANCSSSEKTGVQDGDEKAGSQEKSHDAEDASLWPLGWWGGRGGGQPPPAGGAPGR